MKTRAALLLLLIAGLASATGIAAERLVILHSNDVHGHLRPCSYPSIAMPGSGSLIAGRMQSGSPFADLAERRDVGGIARRAALAARIRAGEAARGVPVWLVDAGDIFHYSAFSDAYHGEADVLAMNRAGYDLATLGNHDFEVPTEQVRRLVAAARFPFLCANVRDRATGRPLAETGVVRQVGATRVGVFGLLTGGMAGALAGRGLEVEDPLAAAAAEVARLRGSGRADLVVLVSHCGETVDRRIAERVPGIDVIVGGHSHTRLPQGEVVWRPERPGAGDVGGTLLVQAGEWGVELGRLDLLLDRDARGRWSVRRHQARLLPVTRDLPEDPAVAALLDSLWAPLAARGDEVLATAALDFANRGDDLPQSALAADAVRAATGAEVAFERPGGMHWPIVAGPVTRAQLVDFDQRRDSVVTFGMRGAEIRRFLARSAPVPSGLRYRTLRGELQAVTVGDAPLDDARVYACAAGSSLAARMGDYELLAPRATGRPWTDVVLEAIRAAGTLVPAYDGRRIVVDTLRAPSRGE